MTVGHLVAILVGLSMLVVFHHDIFGELRHCCMLHFFLMAATFTLRLLIFVKWHWVSQVSTIIRLGLFRVLWLAAASKLR